MYGVPAITKIPKSEEWQLDEVGFAFVTKCIEVLEARGKKLRNLNYSYYLCFLFDRNSFSF